MVAKLSDQHLTIVFRERHDIEPGDAIQLALNLNKNHLFDAASSERIA